MISRFEDEKDGIAVMTHLWEEPEYNKKDIGEISVKDYNDNHFHEMTNPNILIKMKNPTDQEYKELTRLEKTFNRLIKNVKMSIGFSYQGTRNPEHPEQKVLFP